MRALMETIGLGFAAAIAPCVMAANIAAVAYISRKMTDPQIHGPSPGCFIRWGAYSLIR